MQLFVGLAQIIDCGMSIAILVYRDIPKLIYVNGYGMLNAIRSTKSFNHDLQLFINDSHFGGLICRHKLLA